MKKRKPINYVRMYLNGTITKENFITEMKKAEMLRKVLPYLRELEEANSLMAELKAAGKDLRKANKRLSFTEMDDPRYEGLQLEVNILSSICHFNYAVCSRMYIRLMEELAVIIR